MEPPCLASIPISDLELDASEVLSTSPFHVLRTARWRGSEAMLLSFKGSAKAVWWKAALDSLSKIASVNRHPAFVQVYGIAFDCTNENRSSKFILLERMPLSLFDALHIQRTKLSPAQIIYISIKIWDILHSLHLQNEAFGSPISSKRVMLGRDVKLRRYNLDLVREWAELKDPLTDLSACKLHRESYYEPLPASPASSSEDTIYLRDIYAFGVLVLEMCTNEKPYREFSNRYTSVGRINPILQRAVEQAFNIGQTDPSNDAVALEVVRANISDLVNKLRSSQSHMHLSTVHFEHFLESDTYFQELQSSEVAIGTDKVRSRYEVDLKRLSAVERELVEEQENFSVLVKQFEWLQEELRQSTSMNGWMRQRLESHENALMDYEAERIRMLVAFRLQEEVIRQLEEEADARNKEMDKMISINESRKELIETLKTDISKSMEAKQALGNDNKRLEDANKDKCEQVRREKMATEEVGARLEQTIYRWQQEQRAHRKTARRLESMQKQLLALEDERSAYTIALQKSPIGRKDANESISHVLSLKEKEVEKLTGKLHEFKHKVIEYETKLIHNELAIMRNEEERYYTKNYIDNLIYRKEDSDAQVIQKTQAIDALVEKEKISETTIQKLQTKLDGTTTKLNEIMKECEAKDLARKQRRCLTANCDAPPYLVQPSGYCSICTDKKYEHNGKVRSESDMSKQQNKVELLVQNNAGNADVLKVLKSIRKLMKQTELCTPMEVTKVSLLQSLKKLTMMMKEDESLKDDLYECRGVKLLLELLRQFDKDMEIQLEGCRLISTVVFNHERNRILIVAEGAIDNILSMMTTFATTVKVQEASCVVLTNLAHNCESNRQRILGAGGIDAVLQCMQAFPLQPGIQKRSCWALLTLAGSDYMCEAVASCGAVGAIIAAMLNCPKDVDIQHYGSWAILNIISGTTSIRDFARQEGVSIVLEAALTCFPDHDGVQEKAKEALELLEYEDVLSARTDVSDQDQM